jgi:hypothetical protein
MTESISRRPGFLLLAALLLALGLTAPFTAAHAEHRLGGGVHYWRTLDEIGDEIGGGDIDEDGLSALVSYQYAPGGLLKFQIDAEYFEKGFGGAEDDAISPQVYVLVGGTVYAGVGAGIIYSDNFDDGESDPFYAARLGLDMRLLPRLHLDVNANYRTTEWDNLEDADTDTITLGAVVRFAF